MHLLLKFNYGVEIGAHLAYVGHYRRLGDPAIRLIAREELKHRGALRRVLRGYNEKPQPVINAFFKVIGTIILHSCKYAPESLLGPVAQGMELFAIFSYSYLAKVYPQHAELFTEMAKAETRHKLYFQCIK